MHLIFGGAYQGKLDYAIGRYGLIESDIYTCSESEEIDFSKKAVNRLEDFVLHCLRHDMEAKDYLKSHQKNWQDKVIICTDLSSGIVPYEAELRAWREMTGRTMVYLGGEAEEVTRMFCGIPQRLK